MELNLLPSIINTHDLSVLWPYAQGPHFKYFNWESGNEHYCLLFHISWQIPIGSTIIDIGTSTGHSALALSANPNINVITYNILDEVQDTGSIKQKTNIDIRIKNCLEDMNDLLKAPFIFLDVFHEGTFERQLIEELIKNNYNGIVLCDDIYLNEEMLLFWNWVPLPKMDITEYGHWSGTGAILFGNSTLTILHPVTGLIAPLYNRRNYKYTQTWFLTSEIHKLLLNYIDVSTKNTILEIGCFEGLSSVFFADNLLNNPYSSLTCVDPFLNINNNDHSKFLMNNEEKHFDHNIRNCKNANKIQVHKITSDDFFTTNNKTYNFIYIDGCHECDFITRDMENAFKVLDKNGIMWMDDYLGADGIKIRDTMDRFLDKYKNQYNILYKGYQLAIRKI
jgi:predicted O-methyltransferase YrrM